MGNGFGYRTSCVRLDKGLAHFLCQHHQHHCYHCHNSFRVDKYFYFAASVCFLVAKQPLFPEKFGSTDFVAASNPQPELSISCLKDPVFYN